MGKLLYDEPSRVFSPTLATIVGLNESIVCQQLHFRLQLRRNLHAGRYWVYDSYDEWQQSHFPWWSAVTVKRIFTALENSGVVISCQAAKASGDCRKWYTLDYERLTELTLDADPSGQIDPVHMDSSVRPPQVSSIPPLHQVDPTPEASLIHSSDQIDPLSITKTPPKTPSKEAAAKMLAAADDEEQFEAAPQYAAKAELLVKPHAAPVASSEAITDLTDTVAFVRSLAPADAEKAKQSVLASLPADTARMLTEFPPTSRTLAHYIYHTYHSAEDRSAPRT